MITHSPLDSTGRAALPHPAPTLGEDANYCFPPGREGSKIAQDGTQHNPGIAVWSRFRAP